MPRTAQNLVDVSFCDGTTTEERYDADNWGNISALDSFRKFVEKGQENDKIWAHKPHVVRVHILMPDDPAGVLETTERFTCPCSGRKVLVGT